MKIADYVKLQAAAGKKKPNKYNAKCTPRCLFCGGGAIRDGQCMACHSSKIHVFDSKAEAARWWDLKRLSDHGSIEDLCYQVRHPITVNNIDVGSYIADFTYIEVTAQARNLVIEDVKGGKATDTPLSKFKRKCVEAQYGCPVTIFRT